MRARERERNNRERERNAREGTTNMVSGYSMCYSYTAKSRFLNPGDVKVYNLGVKRTGIGGPVFKSRFPVPGPR